MAAQSTRTRSTALSASAPTALITGAGRGLGLEFARQCRARGMRVIGAVRNPDRAEALIALSKEDGPPVDVVALDVGDAASIDAVGAAVGALTDRVDLLVNNAGINSMSAGIPDEQRNLKLGTLEAEGIATMVRVNAIGPILVTQALLPLLEAADDPRVILISSWLGSMGKKAKGGNYGYCGSKATLNMLGRALALDLVDKKITCALFNPGWVQTDMGGKRADLTPEDSVGGILKAAMALTLDDNGRFLNHDGEDHPW